MIATMTVEREWLTIAEAAGRAGLSISRIHQLRRENVIRAERAGTEENRGVWLVYWPDLKKYLEK